MRMSTLRIARPRAIPVAVSGQVVDVSGITWGFAVLQFSLFVPSGQKPIDLTTGLVIPNPAPIIAGATGLFTVNLQQNQMIVPDSQWRVTIYPFNAPDQGQTLSPFVISGGRNISALIHANLQPFDIGPPLVLPLSHNAAVGRSLDAGSAYYDVNSPGLFVRDPAAAAYVKIGPGAAPPAQVYPGAGIAVSTGSAWGTSLPVTPPVVAYVENTATQTPQTKIITGVGPLAAGIFNATFASSFPAGTFPAIFLSLTGAEAPGTTTVPVIWLFSVTNTSFSVHASSTTSTDIVRWMAVGIAS